MNSYAPDEFKRRFRMNRSIFSKFLAFVLALVMVFSMLPVSALATGTPATYKKVDITAASDIKAGTYLIYGTSSQAIDDGSTAAFMSTENSTEKRLMSSDLEISGDSVTTDDENSVWNLIAAEGGFYVQNAGNSKYLYYGSNSGNNIYQTADESAAGIWTVVANGDNWTLQETASGRQLSCNRFGSSGSYYLGFASYASASSTERALEFYKLDGSAPVVSTVATPTAAPASGEVKAGTQVTFSCATEGASIQYKTGSGDWTPYTAPVTVNEAVTFTVKATKEGMTDSDEATFSYTIQAEEPTYDTIAEALAGESGTTFTVKGVVTLVDGKNIYVQDATGGIDLYFSTAPMDIALGDTIVGTGTRTAYNGLPELTGATYEKSSGLTLTAKETTIGELTAADVCTYISLKGVEVTEVYDKDGTYTAPNITVTDGTGSIQLYRAVVGKTDGAWDIKVGDKIDIQAALSIYNTTLQLRNTLTTEITVAEPEPTYDTIAEAIAGADGESFTVKGVVTLVDSQNIYVQDATGGICVRMSAKPEDISLGDTIVGTGSKTTYRGMPQLGSGTYEKSSGLTLTAKETTIDALTTADVCTYVKLTGLEVAEVYDNSGAYSNPNVTFSDGTNSIQLYKGVVGKTDGAWDLKVGDKVDITAAVGINNTTLQLRNTLTTEITVAEPEPTYDTIAEAIAGTEGESFTVKGVVTLVDGQNIYLQDATGGICVRMSAKPEDISLGDTIVGTGSKTTYRGMPQLGSGTYEKSSGLTLTAKETTIDALTKADVCTYVKLTGLEVTEVYDNNGAYSNPNVTFSDGTNSIQLYKAVVGKTDGTWDLKVGDKVDITAAVGINNTTLQLRNTLTTEITPAATAPEGPLAEGDRVVIYNVANMKALSTKYSGFYNSGVAVSFSGDDLTGFTAAEVWTVGVNADGTYTFSTSEGKKLSMGASHTSTPLDDVNTGWNVLEAATDGCYYIQNAVRGNYLEWYADKDNWSSYSKVSNEALFAQAFYKVTGDLPSEGSTLPAEGSQVVIYNLSAQGVLASQDDNVDSPSITGVSAEIVGGKAVPENGGVIFTVEKNGEYYRFRNETYGYLCSNGTGNNAFYSTEASEDADWTLLDGKKGGFNMESRTAKYNGKYDQYLEYYADAYKTYSMYNVTDYDIYEFFFYGIGEDVSLTEGIVNRPRVDFGTLADAYLDMDYTFTFTVEAVFGVDGELTVKAGKTGEDGKPEETVLTANEDGSYTVPKEWIAEPSLTITVTGKDTKGVTIFGTAAVTVKDEPVIGDVTPLANSETGENRKPLISAQVFNVGENPEITMTIGDTAVEAGYDAEAGLVSYEPAQELAEGRTTVTVKVVRADGKETEKTWSFTVGRAQNQLYFGQLHSHTTYSDGSGTLDSALEYVANLPGSANVDFVAFTDHSNYFDQSGAANPEGALYDMGLATEYSQGRWNEFKSKVAAFNGSQSDIVALGGFEMTWSGGPGHINTFNTPGIVSRNNSTLNNKTSDAGMKAYYALLSQSEGAASISQFNHPGSTFGTFSDFAYYDAMIDSRIFLVEVGNGEGQVGAGGYYPSYEYYTMALDKGWHVAPTNNQDNHKGKWGNANDARDVIYTDDFSEQGLYEAIRNMRVYATEDKNLEITYSVNGLPLGSSISEVPGSLDLAVTVYDPDTSDSISKVEVIVNSGKTIHTWNDPADLASGSLSVTLSPDYSYYYIRVTEGDGDLAVTAPVWVGEPLKLGISSLECGTSTPVTDEELTLTTTLFNSEASDATVTSVTYTTGSTVLGTDTAEYTIPASGTLAIEFDYTPTVAKVMTVTATVVVEQNGKEYTFTKDIELDVQDASKLSYIGIDASHFNEYVAGNYKDSMGNFGELAAQYALRTVQLNSSEDLIAACENAKYKAIILTAPSRRNGSALRDPYATYSDEEINALVAFNKAGGAVILAGWSDYYESYATFPTEDHMAAQQNKVLKALGSALRIGDDGTNDDSLNGGQTQRLYFNTYGTCFLTEGVEVDPEHPNDRMYTEVFSHYGGASVYAESGDSLPSTATAVVFAHSSTYSMDSDSDGLGGSIPKYPVSEGDERLLVMAMDELPGQGLIIVSGAAFMSNFEVQATISDSGSEKNYANYKICENLLQRLNPVTLTTIAEVRAQTEAGFKYTIEGVVTSNASGYDKDTAFFDCIYVQDATGGICCFPVAGNFKVGDKVRITGTTDFYQGEPELQVTSIEKIGDATPVEPTAVTAAQISNRSAEGKLVTLSGTVESFEMANGLVQTIMVKDAAGNVARVFIDGYITTSQDVENLDVGAAISVTGLASYDDTFNAPEGPFPRIRVRDRADVICTLPEHDCEKEGHVMDDGVVTKEPTCTEKGEKTYTCKFCKATETKEIPALGHDWDDGVITKKPTCTRKGEMTYTCERCQITKTEPIPALGHHFKNGVCTRCHVDQKSVFTGDTIMIWILVLVVSAAAIVVLLLFSRKKKNGKNGKYSK